jgi:hypothetical protein
MTSDDTALKAFSDLGIHDIPAEAGVSRSTLRRLVDIDDSTTRGPTGRGARAKQLVR